MKTKGIVLSLVLAVICLIVGFVGGSFLDKLSENPQKPSDNIQTDIPSEQADEWTVKAAPMSEEAKAILRKGLPNMETTNEIVEENDKLYKKCEEMKDKILKSIENYYDNYDETIAQYIDVEDIKEAFLDYYEESLEYIQDLNDWEKTSVEFEYWNGTIGGLEMAVRENNAIYTFYNELCSINQRY